jgi:Effector Associated Constant Component 1
MGEQPAEQLRSLMEWLGNVEGLRGRVRAAEGPPVAGTLGPVLEAVMVALGPAGAATGLATVLVSWIRHRTSDIELQVSRSDGTSAMVSAKRVRGLGTDELREQVLYLTQVLNRPETDPEPPRGSEVADD